MAPDIAAPTITVFERATAISANIEPPKITTRYKNKEKILIRTSGPIDFLYAVHVA
jgi:hypothetical protein